MESFKISDVVIEELAQLEADYQSFLGLVSVSNPVWLGLPRPRKYCMNE